MRQEKKVGWTRGALVGNGLWRMALALTAWMLGGSLGAQPELGECDQEVEEVVQKQIPRAQSAWANKNYREAERYLERAIRLNNEYADALYLMGDLMLKKTEFLKAEAIFSKLMEVCPDYKAEVKYYLGILLVESGKEERGVPLLEDYLEDPEREFGRDREVKETLQEVRARKDLRENPVDFEPEPVRDISTPDDEYLATISPDQETMYFTRRSEKINRKDGPAAKVRMVEEFSRAERREEGNFEVGEPMPSPFNKQYNEGGPSITADNTELYFTVCEDRKGYKDCNVFYSERDPYGYWTTPKSVGDHINRRDTWESQPSVSANGDALYFASDRNGGVGGLDIYRCERKEDGSWSRPRALDENVNTPKDEKTPFIHSDSRTLYFTSEGHPGMGGFDIFYARSLGDTAFEPAQNIGYPVNGEDDDLGLFVSLDGRTAYFASNKIRSNSGWDLFSFSLPSSARPDAVGLISGTMEHEENEELEGASLELKNLRTQEVTKVKVNEETGNFAHIVRLEDQKEDDLILSFKKKGAAFSSRYLKGNELAEQRVLKAPLQMASLEVGKEYELNDINFASNSHQLDRVARSVIDEFVIYLKENPGLKADIQGHTDNVGGKSDNLQLSQKRAKEVYDYVVKQGIASRRLSHHGYGEKRPIADNVTEKGRAQNRRTVFVITSR